MPPKSLTKAAQQRKHGASSTTTRAAATASQHQGRNGGNANPKDRKIFCKGGPKQPCVKPVCDEDEGLQCDHCESWFHADCQEIDIES